MILRNALLIFLLTSICSCSKRVVAQGSEIEEQTFQVVERSVNSSEIRILLKNTTDSQLLLHNPLEKRIERKNGDEWEKVSVLYCDCGVSCAPPPEVLQLESGGTYTFEWDRNIEKCVEANKQLMTERSQAQTGSYLAVFYYSIQGTSERQLLKVPFDL